MKRYQVKNIRHTVQAQQQQNDKLEPEDYCLKCFTIPCGYYKPRNNHFHTGFGFQ